MKGKTMFENETPAILVRLTTEKEGSIHTRFSAFVKIRDDAPVPEATSAPALAKAISLHVLATTPGGVDMDEPNEEMRARSLQIAAAIITSRDKPFYDQGIDPGDGETCLLTADPIMLPTSGGLEVNIYHDDGSGHTHTHGVAWITMDMRAMEQATQGISELATTYSLFAADVDAETASEDEIVEAANGVMDRMIATIGPVFEEAIERHVLMEEPVEHVEHTQTGQWTLRIEPLTADAVPPMQFDNNLEVMAIAGRSPSGKPLQDPVAMLGGSPGSQNGQTVQAVHIDSEGHRTRQGTSAFGGDDWDDLRPV